MPWKETCVMEERMRFVMEVKEGFYSKAQLCRTYGISRPTGDKWLERYALSGVEGLRDLSRAPLCHPNEVGEDLERRILAVRGLHGHWGPKKILAYLEGQSPEGGWPARSTIGALLQRLNLSVPRKRRRRAPPHTEPFAACDGPNAVWCTDFKGWFRTGDGLRCDPLTISDAFSRYLFRCQATDVRGEIVEPLFVAAFREYGVPWAILSDNGSPFASRGIGGLSRLSVSWVKLDIVVERIAPGHPEQNGRHERMHLTLKQETASPPAATGRAQQKVFNRFRREFNEERPHEALDQRTPASVYRPSPRVYPERLGPVEYPCGMDARCVQKHGEFYWKGNVVFLGEALRHERIGLEAIDGRHWMLWFSRLALGVFDGYLGKVMTWRQAAKVGIAKPTKDNGQDKGGTDDDDE